MIEKFITTSLILIWFGLVLVVLCSLPVMWLWNWLMPVIFGLGKISLMQAFGILLLSTILFKSNVISNNKQEK